MNDRKPYGQTMRGIAKKDDKILVVKRHPKSRHNPEQWEKGRLAADIVSHLPKSIIPTKEPYRS